jgi:hypothetical protein
LPHSDNFTFSFSTKKRAHFAKYQSPFNLLRIALAAPKGIAVHFNPLQRRWPMVNKQRNPSARKTNDTFCDKRTAQT